MAIVRTILWVLILVGLLLFSWTNWQPGISVRIWSNLVVDTRLPAVVVVAFLLGLIPMWLFHRGVIWRLNRRIRHLETAVQPSVAAQTRVEHTDPVPSGPITSANAQPAPAEQYRPLRPSDPEEPAVRP